MAKIVSMKEVNSGKVKAFFTVAVGDFEIEGMKLVDGKNGLFVGFPSRNYTGKDGKTKYIDIVKTDSKTLYTEILQAAVAELDRRGNKAVANKVATDDNFPETFEEEEEDSDLPF